MANYYGIRTKHEIKRIVHDVCVLFGNNDEDLISRSERLMNETLCAESNYGRAPDNSASYGMGIPQIDPVTIDDIKENCLEYRDLVFEAYQIDLKLLHIENLRYDEVTSIICERLVYKRNPDKIPNTRKGRAEYWKKVYNTEKGKGTVKHYIKNSNAILGK